MDYHLGWGFNTWIAALRAETIRVKCNTVVIYLDKFQDYENVLPIKNALHTMCKTINQHQPGIRIFVANLLPAVTTSPVSRNLAQANFTLLQAVRSVNRAMGKVHFLSINEHFVSSSGSIIWPVHQYFMQDNIQLTKYGCMVFRECLLGKQELKATGLNSRNRAHREERQKSGRAPKWAFMYNTVMQCRVCMWRVGYICDPGRILFTKSLECVVHSRKEFEIRH